MFNDIVIIENVFNDPDSIVEFAKCQTFYDREKHPTESTSKWSGSRTLNIGELNAEVFNQCISQVVTKSIEKSFGTISPYKIDASWNSNIFFHQLTDKNVYEDSWIHTDDSHQVYAGIVYLRRNPQVNSGTVIFINNRPVEIQNVFNRLVLYRSDYVHTAKSGFGQTLEDSRLTMNLFFKQLTISINA
jgi:hypothetical protein